MKVEGNFRVFKHVNAGRVNYSLAITVNDENEEFFSELGCKLATLSSNWDTNSGLEPLKRRRVESLLTLRFPLTMMEGEPLMKVEGNFRVFKNVNAGRVNYSLAITVSDENEEFFSELGCKLAKLACENKGKTMKFKSLKPSDLELIKTTANGKYKIVHARIYTNSTGRVTCKLTERKKVKGVFKTRKLRIGNLIDESFKGSCVLRVYQAYVGTSKTITLSVEENMATELNAKRSYFDEYEEMVSDESSSEEAD